MTFCEWIWAAWPVVLVDGVVIGIVGRTLWQLRDAKSTHTDRAGRFYELEEPRPVTLESAMVAHDALTDVVERGIKALEALDRKATLIPPALGVIAGITVPRVNPDALSAPIVMASGLTALVAALLSAAAALAVFFPRGYKAGPDPIESALGTGDPENAYRQGVVNALARAAVSIEGVVTHRAALFFLSVVLLGATIFMLAIVGVNGGFVGGENGSGT